MTKAVQNVYSEALFEIAVEDNLLDTVKNELDAIKSSFDECPDIYEVLSVQSISHEEKINVLKNIFEGKITDTVLDFLCVLTENGRIKEFPGIYEEFYSLWCDKTGVMLINVTSAVKLTDEQRNRLTKALSAKYNKTVLLNEKVDPKILGGVIVNFKDTCLDGSIRAKLNSLKDTMKQGNIK